MGSRSDTRSYILISRALEQLRFWAQRETGQRAGLLVLVGVGFDEDPTLFYTPFVQIQEPHNVSELRENFRSKRHETSINLLGLELASTGWRILAVAGQTTGSATFGAESRSAKGTSFQSASLTRSTPPTGTSCSSIRSIHSGTWRSPRAVTLWSGRPV